MVSWYLSNPRRGEGDQIKIKMNSLSSREHTPVPALFASHDVDAAVDDGDAGPVSPLVHRADKVPRVLRHVVPFDLVRVLGRGVPPA